jgi:hypothetical protein
VALPHADYLPRGEPPVLTPSGAGGSAVQGADTMQGYCCPNRATTSERRNSTRGFRRAVLLGTGVSRFCSMKRYMLVRLMRSNACASLKVSIASPPASAGPGLPSASLPTAPFYSTTSACGTFLVQLVYYARLAH